MANLRTNNLSGEQGQNAYRGSVFFDGQNTRIEITASSDLALGTGDYTIEAWVRFSKIDTYQAIIDFRTNNGAYPFIVRDTDGDLYYFVNGSRLIDNIPARENNVWHHIAVVRSSGTTNFYLNGVSEGNASDSTDYIADQNVDIGASTNDNDFFGYISNLRITKEALYTSTFTPPFSELKVLTNTVLLCCQDSDDPTQEETGKTLTGKNGLSDIDLVKQQPKVIPPYGVDAGNTFGGPIQQSTEGYMYFPTGRTEERGGSRGVCAGGSDPSGRDNDISFIDIQSQGNAIDFGDLSINSHNTAGFSSKTRAIFSLGYIDASPNVSNTLEFITMMTQGNATDFGDVSVTVYEAGAASNDTRGLIAGGYNASPLNNVTNIDFVTIASLGNGSDFGDLTLGRRGLQGCGSPTRSVFASGYQQPDTGTKTNVIDFVTIATAGNAQDFGDLTSQRWGTAACADSTRGVFFGGLTPSSVNVIDFITIATTGNATDFGDLTAQASGRGSSTSNSIRGVYFHGIGSYVNTIGFVTIQTTGDEVDFGDNTYKSHGQGSGSTAHGGLS